MAINPQKLLPPAKISSSIVKAPQSIIKKTNTPSFGSSTLTDNITIIKTKVIQIEDILKGTLASEKKALDQKKRQESGKRREEQEEKLEKKPNAEKAKIKMPSAPKMGIFGWIKKFITNIILGYFAVRLVDHLPKIIPIVKFLGTAADFIINVGGKLLNGLITFIDWGYKAYDATRGFIKNLGGENFAQGFDKFVSAIDTTLFLTSVLAADLALEAATGGDDGGPGREIARKPARVFGRGAARAATRFGLKTIGKGGTKAVLNAVRPLVRNAPLIGGLLEFGISWALGDPLPKAAFRGVGTALLGAVGTAIGGPIGLAIGGYAGGELGGVLYDMFFNNKKPSQKGKVQGKAGGGITRGGKTQGGVRRTIGGVKKKGKYKRELAQKPTKIEIKTDDKNLKETGEQLDKTKYFGPILAITSKIMAKQEPTQKDYENVGLGINLLISKGIEEDQLKGGLVAAFAEGGMVDSDFLEAAEKGSDISNWVAKTFKGEIESNAQKTLRLIKEKKEEKQPTKAPEMTPEGIPLGEGETASGRNLMQGLIQRGFTKEEASAIVGNLWAESGFRTTATNPTSGAFGLMQWLGGRKSRLYSYATEKGKSVTDVDLQLDYIKWELKGGNAYETAQFKKAMAYGPDVASKTRGFAEQVERAGAGELRSSMSKRIGAAESVYGGKMVAGERPSIELGKGYGSEGSKIAGELGRFMKKKGVVPGSIHRHPEHPPYSLTSGHSRGSLHYQGRAIDLGGNANEQGPILAAIAEFNRLKGVKPVQLLHAGNEPRDHSDHVHVAYHRGKVRSGRETIARILKDEKVLDTDTSKSLDMIDPLLVYKLNKASTKEGVLRILQSYAGYEQPYAEPEVIEIPVEIPVPVPMGGGSSGGVAFVPIGGGSDPFETLYQGG